MSKAKTKKLTKLQFALSQLTQSRNETSQANLNFYQAKQVNDDNVRKFKAADDNSARVIRELSDKLLVAKAQAKQLAESL